MIKVGSLSILLTILMSCDTTPRIVEYPITNNEIRNALSNKEGSYFVYKDSLTGVKDSMWVYSPFNNWASISLGDHHDKFLETMGFFLKDSLGEVGSIATDGSGSKGDNYIIRGGIFRTSSNIYSLHFILNQTDSNSQGYYLFNNFYDSIIINGTQYFGVLKSSCKTSEFESTTYFNLSVGILKSVIKTDSSTNYWELSKYHIER